MKKTYICFIIFVILLLFGCNNNDNKVLFADNNKENLESFVFLDTSNEDVQSIINSCLYNNDGDIVTFNFEENIILLNENDYYTFHLIRISPVKYYICLYSAYKSSEEIMVYDRAYFNQATWIRYDDNDQIKDCYNDLKLDFVYSVQDYFVETDVINSFDINKQYNCYNDITQNIIDDDFEVDNNDNYFLLFTKKGIYEDTDSIFIFNIDEKVKFGYCYYALKNEDGVFILICDNIKKIDSNETWDCLSKELGSYYDKLYSYMIIDDPVTINDGEYVYTFAELNIEELKSIIKRVEQ